MKRFAMFLACVLALCGALAVCAAANSAEPPGLVVVVYGAPDDLELSVAFGEGVEPVALHAERTAWESCYRFRYGDAPEGYDTLEGAALAVSTGGEAFSVALPADVFGVYNNVVTLDLGSRTVTAGAPAWRAPALVASRVALTLIVEGAVFALFAYRSGRSWLVFVLVNLATQIALNVALTGSGLTGGYWQIAYVFIEFLVFAAEAVAFPVLLREHKKLRAVLYSLCANAASLVLGWALLSYFPV